MTPRKLEEEEVDAQEEPPQEKKQRNKISPSLTEAYKEERDMREERERQEAERELQYQEAMTNIMRNIYWQKRAE